MRLSALPIAEAGKRMRDGRLTAIDLLADHLSVILECDPQCRAFLSVFEDEAAEAARQADRDFSAGIDRGSLQGIPIALKDLIDTRDHVTAYGSRLFAGHRPKADAAVVSRLKQGGAVVLGKVATYEFAIVGPSFDLDFPPSRNPWNPDHITGGSSSGSASAVAGGMVRSAIGTDTGGSIRSPAAYCGVTGLKPTYGRVSRAGVYPLSESLDHVGPVSATVEDAALTLDAIEDTGGRPAGTLAASARIGEPIEGLRIAYARDWFASAAEVEPGVVRATDDALSQLSLLGARVEEFTLRDYALFEAAGAIILHAEALGVHREAMARHPECFGHLAFQSLASGLCLSEGDVQQARRAAQWLREDLDETVFDRFDALVTVNTLTVAPPFSAFDAKTAVWTPMRTLPFNVTGHPSLAVPTGFAGGLPVGMQIVGKWWDEAGICRIGHAYEQAMDLTPLRPALAARRASQSV